MNDFDIFDDENEDHEPLWCQYPDGSLVDMATEEGANGFLDQACMPGYFSRLVSEVRKLRKKQSNNKRLSDIEKSELIGCYKFIYTIANNADHESFCGKVPRNQIQDWLNLIIEEVKSFTKNKKWINSGRLAFSDLIVFKFCYEILMCSLFTSQVIFESELFQVLANFIKARKANGIALPSSLVCSHLGKIVHCTLVTANDDQPWATEKIFKKFEASGILEQILRCSTVPNTPVEPGGNHWETHNFLDIVLGYLESSIGSVLTQKLKIGEPCGDTLNAILQGRDGSKNAPPKILNRLRGIAALVETFDSTEFKANLAFGSICRPCSKNGDSEAPLFRCAQCLLTYYCSKECQRADWKRHKHNCRRRTKRERDKVLSLRMATLRFLNRNFKTVFEEIKRKCDRTGLEASDIAVEIDFMPNSHGIIPALQNPPVFKIALIQDYKSGQEIPGWLRGDSLTDFQRTTPEWLHTGTGMIVQLELEQSPKKLTELFETECIESTSAVLLLHHARSVYIDNETLEQYAQADLREKLLSLVP